MEQLVKHSGGNQQDLGSIPGPPPFPYIFLIIVFLYNSLASVHPMALHPGVPPVPLCQTQGQDLEHMVCLSPRVHMPVQKSNEALKQMDLNC